MADFSSTVHEGNKRRVNVTPIKVDGTPGAIQPSSLAVTTIAGDGVVVATDDGGYEYALGPSGPTLSTYLVKADADLGEGVREIQATVDGLGLVGEAVAFGGFSEGAETPL